MMRMEKWTIDSWMKLAVLLSGVAIIIAFVAVGHSVATKSAQDARAARTAESARQQSRAQCVRSQRNGPPFIAFLTSFDGTPHEFDRTSLRFFRDSIPKTCP